MNSGAYDRRFPTCPSGPATPRDQHPPKPHAPANLCNRGYARSAFQPAPAMPTTEGSREMHMVLQISLDSLSLKVKP